MRKYLNIIFITILCFLSINMVYADKCDELIMYANSGFYKATDVVLSYGTSHIYYSKYTLNDSNSSTAPAYSAYCRNAGVTASKDYNGIKFKCDHQIFDTASTDEEQKTYEAGIVGILKNGYGTKNPSYLTYLQV